MSASVLSIRGLSKSFGGFQALSDVSFDVFAGERLGLIGPNGSGKTTLMNCISGVLNPNSGTATFLGTDLANLPPHRRTRLGMCRTFQIPRPFASMTVAENLSVPQAFASGRKSETHDIVRLLQQFRLGGKANASVRTLSQVELRKLELARAMAAQPKLLISDESMAGLSSSEIDEVLDLLKTVCSSGVAVIMIEHIMRAMMSFSDRILCLDSGKLIAEGSPAAIMADKNVQRAYLGA